MIRTEEKLMRCFDIVKKKVNFVPETAIVLGSGLGAFADEIEVCETLSYNEIEGFPVSTVKGHKGRFVFGYVGKKPVVIMQGRVHFYEGYPITDVVLPIRLMKLMGAKKLILTNAAGGINKEFNPGDLMLIEDHISSFVKSPLIGPNIDSLGDRFPDMSEVYSKRMIEIAKEEASKLGINIRKGVYVQLSGPNYETPAEIRMCKAIGADAVGMSTTCEAMAARHMKMEICGISCITNMAAGISDKVLDHKEVQETAAKVEKEFKALLTELVKVS